MKRINLFLLIAICFINSYAQIYIHPQFDRTNEPNLLIDSIVVNKTETLLYCMFNVDGGLWANISNHTVLRDCKTGKELSILKCEGLPFAPERKSFQYAGKHEILFVFPKLDPSSLKIDFIESEGDDGFNIYGIDLQKSNDSSLYQYNLDRSFTLSSSADFYCTSGNYNRAIELEEQAMNIKKAYLGCKSAGYASSVFNLAWYYYKAGFYKKAIVLGNEDLKLCSELLGTNNETYGISLMNLATFYSSFGKYVEAEFYERQTIELFLKLYGKEHQQYALAISNLSQILYSQGHYNEAIRYEKEALDIREHIFGKNSIEFAMSLHSLSLSYAAIGDIPKAINLITEATNIKQNIVGRHDSSYIMSLNNLASFYSMENEYQKAFDIEKEALQLSEIVYGTNHPEYATIISNLGGYSLRLEKEQEANNFFEKALDINKHFYGVNSEAYAISLNNFSQQFLQHHNFDKAISYGVDALKILDVKNPMYITLLNNLAHIYACANDYKKATEIQKKAIALVKDKMATEFYQLDSESKYLFWKEKHLIFDVYPSYVAKNQNSSNLSDLYNSILFSKGIVWQKQSQTMIEWKDIQSNLQDDDIAIEFISSMTDSNDTIRYYALTIKKDQESPKMFELFNSKQFEDSMMSANSNYDKNLKVGNLVWKPIEEELRNVKNIYFSTTNVLNCIAIEYLPINSSENYSDLYSMYRLSSTKELTKKYNNKSISHAILYGGLEYEPVEESLLTTENTSKRSGFEPLYNTYTEVSKISDILKNAGNNVSIFTGTNGTEQSFRNLSGVPIDVLHIATHGMYIKQDEVLQKIYKENYSFIHSIDSISAIYQANVLTRSFLVFSNGNNIAKKIYKQDNNDGIITALDISQLDFSGVNLVTLSACESALGEFGADNEILGLQRGFKIAGANTILMSLNKVDDEATRIFMVEFYKNLMSGKSKHQSLKDAQKHLRKVENGKYDDPKYWASFIMLDGLN